MSKSEQRKRQFQQRLIDKQHAPDVQRNRRLAGALQWKGSLTPQVGSRVLGEKEGPRCEICRCCTFGGVLYQDHDHITLKDRGLLCSQCNSGLGMFADDKDWLFEAALYLLDRTQDVGYVIGGFDPAQDVQDL